MQFHHGYLSPYFITNADRMEASLNEPLVWLHGGNLLSSAAMLSLLEAVVDDGRPLLIITENIEAKALATLVVNKLRGRLKVVAVKAPGLGVHRKAILQDIASITGGHVINEVSSLTLENTTIDMLGKAQRVVVKKAITTIVGGAGARKSIEGRITHLQSQIENATSDRDRQKLRERLVNLDGS